MKAFACIPSYATGIIVAHMVPYARSHDTRLGRESTWPEVLSGSHFLLEPPATLPRSEGAVRGCWSTVTANVAVPAHVPLGHQLYYRSSANPQKFLRNFCTIL